MCVGLRFRVSEGLGFTCLGLWGGAFLGPRQASESKLRTAGCWIEDILCISALRFRF